MHARACQYFSGKDSKGQILCRSFWVNAPSVHAQRPCMLSCCHLTWALLTSAGTVGRWSLHWTHTPTRQIPAINQVSSLSATVQCVHNSVGMEVGIRTKTMRIHRWVVQRRYAVTLPMPLLLAQGPSGSSEIPPTNLQLLQTAQPRGIGPVGCDSRLASCLNKANLRDLIAATGPVISLKLDSNQARMT